MPRKHTMPDFLTDVVTPEAYERWLTRKARAHVKRDRTRNGSSVTVALYKESIHGAVVLSEGKDAYTGEKLHWQLISTYKNEDSKLGRSQYKAQFASLPTVDHVGPGVAEGTFRICAWRTNDAKNDLSHAAFLDLCAAVLRHSGYTVSKKVDTDLKWRRAKRQHR